MAPLDHLPVVDISAGAVAAAGAIDAACREVGFFYLTGHGVDAGLERRLEDEARTFFALPDEEKSAIAMERGGRAWRGWFPVGGELTSGIPDLKEGLYFGAELPAGDPRPMHGPNLFPVRPAGLRDAVLAYTDALTAAGQEVLRAIAIALGHDRSWFEDGMTREPLTLFRIFHYPPDSSGTVEQWGVGEHTDYGLLTLLRQDQTGGLEVRAVDGSWIDAPPIAGTFVCNIGDMLARISGGSYRSTAHRVRNASGRGRLSFPFFLDPGWDADVLGVRYGDYVLSKVAKVFPVLADTTELHP